MNALKNKVILIGNIGKNAEIRTFENGNRMAQVTLATNDSYKDRTGQRVFETQWHNLVIWGKQAEYAERLLLKGAEVAVEGKLVNRNYTDKEGNKKYFTEIVVSEFNLLGRKASNN